MYRELCWVDKAQQTWFHQYYKKGIMVFGMMLTKVDGPTLFWAGRFMLARVCSTVLTVQSPWLSSLIISTLKTLWLQGCYLSIFPDVFQPYNFEDINVMEPLRERFSTYTSMTLTQLFNIISLSGTSPSLTTSDRSPVRNFFLKVNHPISHLWSSLDQTLAIHF